MARVVAIVFAVVTGVGALLCFSHQSSVVVDGEQVRCQGTTFYTQLVSGTEAEQDQPLRPAGCEAEHRRWMVYAGGLALLSAAATTGAVFGGRREELEPT